MDNNSRPIRVVDVSPRFGPKCLQIYDGQTTYLITKNSRIALVSYPEECYLVDTFDGAPLRKGDFSGYLFELLLKYNCMFHESCNKEKYDGMFNINNSFLLYSFDLDAISSLDFKKIQEIKVVKNSIPVISEVANWMLLALWENINTITYQDRDYYFRSLIQTATILSADLPNIPYPNLSFSYEKSSAISDLIGHLEKLADYAIEHREFCRLPGTTFAFRNIISYMKI